MKIMKKRFSRLAAASMALALVLCQLSMAAFAVEGDAPPAGIEETPAAQVSTAPEAAEVSTPADPETSADTPADAPTEEPSDAPVEEPTDAPMEEPTDAPVEEPTDAPVEEPSGAPVEEPSDAPVEEPTDAPAEEPTDAPTEEPTDAPAEEPTDAPTEEPTDAPAEEPTDAPVEEPTVEPLPVPEPDPVVVPEIQFFAADAAPAGNTARSADTQGSITVDGDAADWEAAGLDLISAPSSNGVNVSGLRVAMGTDGTLYICIEGEDNQYQLGNADWLTFTFTQTRPNQYNPSEVTSEPKTISISELIKTVGADHALVSDALGNSAAPYALELAIPAPFTYYGDTFDPTDPTFALYFNGASFPSSAIPTLDGVDNSEEEGPATYKGIEIDGKFKDWDAVARHEADCKHDPSKHDPAINCIDQMAASFDGDYVYVYVHETVDGGASGAGQGSNGLYSITTDLGYPLIFQLNRDGTVSGPEGAMAAHIGSQWEVAIPVSELPYYQNSISVGLYLEEPFISDIANLDGSKGNVGEFEGDIKIDGEYNDWISYPHTEVEYATQGTQSGVEDSMAAIYTDGSALYGHVSTNMDKHLEENGSWALAAISIAFNGDREHKGDPKDGGFYPKMVYIGDDGKPVVVDEKNKLGDGTYTFYIYDTRDGFYDINNMTAEEVMEHRYGTMKVTVNGDLDQMEFELDLEKVAEYTGMKVTDMKVIEAQFGRLGQEWVTVAGTSSGPLLGVAVSLAAVGAVLLPRKRKSGDGDTDEK